MTTAERYKQFEKELATAVFPIIEKYRQFDVEIHVGVTAARVIAYRVVENALVEADEGTVVR